MVEVVGQMVLGLGLFFIGMHLVGENLRHLSSRSFRTLVARFTADSSRGSLLGLVFGALMQSATAVTFILANMVGSGLIGGRQALPIIAWANVGLTVLAFVAGLNIRTEVVYLVGLSGLAMAFLKRPGAQLLAGVCVGISLLLFGLQTISAGARPLHEFAWFQQLLSDTVRSPLIGFGIGFLLALLMQSNTAATLIAIALATAGALDLGQASIVIYGTNLGAIVIRLVLAAGLRGSAMQLVRFEDFFCLVSGILMVALFYTERWLHVPLVGALARWLSPDLSLQLAVVFLLSNLLPALLLWPLLGVVAAMLRRLWPPGKEEEDAVSKFLQPQALADPGTALDLVLREEARLLRHAGGHIKRLLHVAPAATMTDEDIQRAFASLQQAIADFTTALASNPAALRSAERLRLAEAELALIGDLEESARELAESFPETNRVLPDCAGRVLQSLAETWDLAFRAADGLQADDMAKLRDATRRRGPLTQEVQALCMKPEAPRSPEAVETALDLSTSVERLAWMLHRLAKLLADATAHGAMPGLPGAGGLPESSVKSP
jgi:phosphate:Na+ symporter